MWVFEKSKIKGDRHSVENSYLLEGTEDISLKKTE